MTPKTFPSISGFELHPTLAADTLPVTRLALSDVLLINDARYLWCLLVPRLRGARDWTDVPDEHKPAFQQEVDWVCHAVKASSDAYKMNVASLGNMVDQLHIHVIARHQGDAAWPGPVWGVGEARVYSGEEAQHTVDRLNERLSVYSQVDTL